MVDNLPSGVVDVLIARRSVESCASLFIAFVTSRRINGRVGVHPPSGAAAGMCIRRAGLTPCTECVGCISGLGSCNSTQKVFEIVDFALQLLNLVMCRPITSEPA